MAAFLLWLPRFLEALRILQPVIIQVMNAIKDPDKETKELHNISLQIKAAESDLERQNAAVKLVNFSFDRK